MGEEVSEHACVRVPPQFLTLSRRSTETPRPVPCARMCLCTAGVCVCVCVRRRLSPEPSHKAPQGYIAHTHTHQQRRVLAPAVTSTCATSADSIRSSRRHHFEYVTSRHLPPGPWRLMLAEFAVVWCASGCGVVLCLSVFAQVKLLRYVNWLNVQHGVRPPPSSSWLTGAGPLTHSCKSCSLRVRNRVGSPRWPRHQHSPTANPGGNFASSLSGCTRWSYTVGV